MGIYSRGGLKFQLVQKFPEGIHSFLLTTGLVEEWRLSYLADCYPNTKTRPMPAAARIMINNPNRKHRPIRPPRTSNPQGIAKITTNSRMIMINSIAWPSYLALLLS